MKTPKIGLALGSGAAKGFAHIGVLKALEENGIEVHAVAGSSAGALIGGLYCSGKKLSQIEDLACKVAVKDWIDLTLPFKGIIKGEKIERIIKDFVEEKYIEELDRKFIAVATNLNDSSKYIFDKGHLHKGIRASISIPGIFEPLRMKDLILVDGAILDRVPVSEIKKLDVDMVIAVDLGFTILDKDKANILDIIIQSVELLTEQAMKSKTLDADIIIKPDLKCISPSRFDLVERAISIGYDATIREIDKIKRKIDDYNKAT